MGLYWIEDKKWENIEPHLPTDVRGIERVDDRRIISGIVHVLKSGCRWSDCPKEYGPAKTVYNRFVRWAKRGVWERLFHAFATPSEAAEVLMIDSTHIKAHRSASGGKGGSKNRRLAAQEAGAIRRYTYSQMIKAVFAPSS